MTSLSSAVAARRAANPASETTAERADRRLEWLTIAASLLILIVHSQIWYAPLTGYSDTPSTSPLLRDIFYPSYACTLLLFGLTTRETLRTLISAPLLIALIAVTGFSVFWSVAPDATARRFVAIVFTTLAGVVLAARWDWRRLAEIVAAAHALSAVLSLLLALLKPDWGVMSELFPGAWRGLWSEKNNMGGAMAMGAGFCLAAAALSPPRRWIWVGFAGLCVFLVLMSTSKTALLALILTLGAVAYVWLVRRHPAVAATMAWLAVIGVILAVLVGLTLSDQVLAWLGKDATLTGRTAIWEGLLRQVSTRPWTGFGYGAIWDNTDPYGPLSWITADAKYKPNHAHNGWLEVLLNIGLIGLTIWALWFVETWARTIFALFTSPAAWLVFPALVAYSIVMMTESVTLNWHDLRWVLFVAFAVKLAAGERRQPAASRRLSSAWP